MKILIIDDHPVLHEILGTVARRVFSDASVTFAETLADGIKRAGESEADLVMLDLGLPDSSGLQTLERFRGACPAPKVIVFSAVDDRDVVLRALKAGAAGYVPKSSRPPVIAAALSLVAAGGMYMPPQCVDLSLLPEVARETMDLTDRQADVLRLILRGLANKEIAKRLEIAEDTVKQHASAAYAVLGVNTRTQAIHLVALRGISLD